MKLRTTLPIFYAALLAVCGLPFGGCKKPTLPNAAKAVPVEAPAPEAAVQPAPEEPPPAPKIKQPDTKGSVVALCYHRFEEKPKDALAITPAAFEAQLQAIKDAGFTVIPMQDFLAWRRGEKSIPDKSCLISIDDGYRSGYDLAWPILKKFGYPFTMFIYTAFVKGGALAGGGSLSWAELAEMRDAGVDIQSHTINHQSLRIKKGKFQNQFATYEDWLQSEIAGSKHQLESRLGISVGALAYPYGIHSEQVRAMALAAGYEAAFTVYGQRLTYHSPADQLGRYAIEHNKPKIFTDAMAMIGGGGGGGGGSAGESAATPVSGQLAAAVMLTVPMEGEVVHELKPPIKANLAAMGEVEPGTVEIRVSGVGPVPVKYDPATKLATGTLLQPLKDREVTVILSALIRGKKVEVRWNFTCDAVGAQAAHVGGAATSATPPASPGVAPSTRASGGAAATGTSAPTPLPGAAVSPATTR